MQKNNNAAGRKMGTSPSCRQRILFLQLMVLLVPGFAGAVDKPGVVSINMCADQLVMLLADREQIRALSYLARDPAGSFYYQKAQDFPSTEGLAEQVVPYAPDVVIAGQYTTPYTVRLLEEIGLRVEVLSVASKVEDIISNVEKVGQWLEQPERAQTVINTMRVNLEKLARPSGTQHRAVVYDPNGYTVGSETLRGQILELAGWENIATRFGVSHYGTLSLEALVVSRPDVMFESPYSPGTWSRAQQLTEHPVLTRSKLKPAIVTIPSRETICGGPWILDVIEQLQHRRQKLP